MMDIDNKNMEKPMIEVKGISKKYDIAHMRGGYVALRDVIANAFKNPFAFLANKTKSAVGLSKKEEFWALKNVSFNVARGEVVGVVGANGAGKSTLLKILSQITPPTEGEVILRGRVGSLLEVGTGFHPELTGRENIFLNGAILGMKKREIAAKFDEIVAFAGVDRFLDTPVKHYSSGMYVRLAFSVAAHMEPDILLIDEVLAVGDAEFQKKCLGKIDEMTKKDGRTILFVSHNLAAVESLCKRTVVLAGGEVKYSGPTDEAISFYMQNVAEYISGDDLTKRKRKKNNPNLAVKSLAFYDKDGQKIQAATTGQDVTMKLAYSSRYDRPLENCRVAVSFRNMYGQDIFIVSTELTETVPVTLPPNGEISCKIKGLPLSRGRYTMNFRFEVNKQAEDVLEDAAVLEVENADFYGTNIVAPMNWEGKSVLVKHSWKY